MGTGKKWVHYKYDCAIAPSRASIMLITNRLVHSNTKWDFRLLPFTGYLVQKFYYRYFPKWFIIIILPLCNEIFFLYENVYSTASKTHNKHYNKKHNNEHDLWIGELVIQQSFINFKEDSEGKCPIIFFFKIILKNKRIYISVSNKQNLTYLFKKFLSMRWKSINKITFQFFNVIIVNFSLLAFRCSWSSSIFDKTHSMMSNKFEVF